MPLSQSVIESLTEADGHLRNALAFSARGERPLVAHSISKLIMDIEHLKTFDGLMDTMDNTISERIRE